MLKLMKQAVPMQKQGLAKRPSTESLSAGAANEELDLHKSWHCLHFMFNEKAEGPDGTAPGRRDFCEESKLAARTPTQAMDRQGRFRQPRCGSVAAALAEFPIEKKASEFDVEAAERAAIYVARHGAEELTEYFGQLRSFYEDAAREGKAVLLWIE
jgi:uncharacterized protein DUF1877